MIFDILDGIARRVLGPFPSAPRTEPADGLENLVVEDKPDHVLLALPGKAEPHPLLPLCYVEIPREALPVVFTETRLAWRLWEFATIYREETLEGALTGRYLADNVRNR